jgi:hypothetical protein
MLPTRIPRRIAAWLALLALLWGALVPTLVQAAVASSDSPGWVEVCSTSGVVWVQVDADAEPPAGTPAPMQGASSSCAWCLPQGAMGLPPTPTDAVVAVEAPEAVPGVAFDSILPSAVWSTAQSRAPPRA